MADKKVTARTVKFPDHIYNSIKRHADHDRRSFQAEVTVLLEEALVARVSAAIVPAAANG